MGWLWRPAAVHPLLPSGCLKLASLKRVPAPAPTTGFSHFSIIYSAQQLCHIEKVGLVNRQLIGAHSDFRT